ncbi:DUF445 family protein [Haloimpatiens sp. FM7330]|uniref:DUF445 family protein n=1 Tax=Haloimpatiens sp. FM7330 TaxID=3298610 RepID=UPI00362736AA
MNKILITTVSGAIIGYITNWLAIKMLFRPYNEKKIGGIKIPFTPGLIPKEKSRIAKSVGEAVGNHLLTKDTMIESLCSEKIIGKLRKWIVLKVESIKEDKSTIESKIQELFKDNYNKIISKFNEKMVQLFIQNLKKKENKIKISEYICKLVRQKLKENDFKIIEENQLFIKVKNNIINKLLNNEGKEKINKELINILDKQIISVKESELKIKDLVPECVVDSLKGYTFEHKREVCLTLKNMLKEEKVQLKIKGIIGETISNNLSPMIAMFLSKDMIHNKLMEIINNFLGNEKNQEDVVEVINSLIDKGLQSNISDIMSNTSEETKEESVKSIVNFITNKVITENNLLEIIKKIENKLDESSSLEEIILDMDSDFYNNIDKVIHNKVNNFIESELLCGKLSDVISEITNSMMQKNVKDIFKGREEKLSQFICKTSENMYNKFIENRASDVIEALDISKIVEDKINSFDVAFAEKIILDIASKELSAITWFGALLGGTMGFISSLIAMA